MHEVIEQDWWLYDSIRGVREHDGISLHLTEIHRRNFEDTYWRVMPGKVPEIYSSPEGHDFTSVDNETYRLIKEAGGNLRKWERNENAIHPIPVD